MSDEWRFRGVVLSAHHQKKAKAFSRLLRMLREDYPLTADDKLALADYLESLKAAPKRGAPPQRVFSQTWHLRRIVEEVRLRAKRESITLEEAVGRVIKIQAGIGHRFDFDMVLQEVRRAAIKKPI